MDRSEVIALAEGYVFAFACSNAQAKFFIIPRFTLWQVYRTVILGGTEFSRKNLSTRPRVSSVDHHQDVKEKHLDRSGMDDDKGCAYY